MTFRLYDTATRAVRDFVPLAPGKVSIYHCGLTVQAPPHVGHIRKEVVFDVLRRWLTWSGFEVTVIANVTDIDDKILVKSAEAGTPWFAHAYRYERELHDAYAALGCLPPTYEPRATGHVPEMLELIKVLIERGHAYPAADGSGDVYFDVRSWPAYGSLSRQNIDDMEAAADADPRGKRDPRDFALWKGHKPSEPETASWPTPWGRGRPGWHLECSAMAGKYLGDEFDIHGGGIDLRFPHHENELAQSTAAGQTFRALLDAQRLGDRGRGEDEQVAGQRGAGRGGDPAVPAARGALLPRPSRTTARRSSSATPRSTRPRPRWPGSTGSSSGRPPWWAAPPIGCRTPSSPRWTTTSARRGRWRWSTTPSGTGTSR